MNVYDFDNTIYKGDSSVDFYKFCLKRHPSVLKHAFAQILGYIGFLLKKYSRTQMKQIFYRYLKEIKNINNEIEVFWSVHKKNLKGWYINNKKRDDDLIISASPEFLLKPLFEELEISLIASKLDKSTGIYDGENCYGDEKTKRFFEKYPNGKINEFYSDSYSDTPLARLAEKAYIVKGNKITEWDFRER